MAQLDNLMIEDADVLFRNFAGREMQFNSEGDRNFCVILEPKMAEQMKADGWNVKELRALEEGDAPKQYIQVSVNYGKGRPPQVVIITRRGRIDLGADEVAMLDFADVKNWDIILNPYSWEVNGKKGVKAYLKKAFVTLNEDDLDLKYSDVPDAQTPTMVPSSIASDGDA